MHTKSKVALCLYCIEDISVNFTLMCPQTLSGKITQRRAKVDHTNHSRPIFFKNLQHWRKSKLHMSILCTLSPDFPMLFTMDVNEMLSLNSTHRILNNQRSSSGVQWVKTLSTLPNASFSVLTSNF
jgi:hypothetical protein